MTHAFQADIDAIGRLPAVQTILEVVCRTTGMGFAAVARVTSDRWIACSVLDEIAFGLKPGSELKVETTICHEIRQNGEAVIIDHVAEDGAYSGHHTPALYGFQSYISMPIILRDGTFFGTLCAIDPKPAQLKNTKTIGMFKLFADLIAFHLDASARADTSEASLLDERSSADLREEFIAVLGHDLRNPLAAIDAGVNLLRRDKPGETSAGILDLMQTSIGRMAGLIDNVMDFARGRLGGGFVLNRAGEDMAAIVAHIVAETRTAWPNRAIEASINVDGTINCDRVRIAQLVSNLLGNAIAHGAPDAIVSLAASKRDGVFELSVGNSGNEIPPAALKRLFHPFVRGADSSQKQGLGLGLYIASEIAKAHGGTLTAKSSPQETRFTFTMPTGPA